MKKKVICSIQNEYKKYQQKETKQLKKEILL